MLVRGVGNHQVDHHLQAQLVGLGRQGVEIGECSEERVHILVVRDVVSEVCHRGCEEGRQPDRVNAKGRNVVEPFCNAVEIADTVAVAVLEGAGIDLVDDRATPPVRIRSIGACACAGQAVAGVHVSLPIGNAGSPVLKAYLAAIQSALNA